MNELVIQWTFFKTKFFSILTKKFLCMCKKWMRNLSNRKSVLSSRFVLIRLAECILSEDLFVFSTRLFHFFFFLLSYKKKLLQNSSAYELLSYQEHTSVKATGCFLCFVSNVGCDQGSHAFFVLLARVSDSWNEIRSNAELAMNKKIKFSKWQFVIKNNGLECR